MSDNEVEHEIDTLKAALREAHATIERVRAQVNEPNYTPYLTHEDAVREYGWNAAMRRIENIIQKNVAPTPARNEAQA